MRAADAATSAGVTVKAMRYYEKLGLISPARLANGYRDYTLMDVQKAREIRTLMGLGLTPRETKPFLACLGDGNPLGDDCPESLVAYQGKIDELDDLVDRLRHTRDALVRRLREAARRGLPSGAGSEPLPQAPLPAGLPVPIDDGGAAHLRGRRLPHVALRSTDGDDVWLDQVATGRWVLFVYPMTGDPATDLPRGWNEIPGARGCSAEACGFRDGFGALAAAGVREVVGLSSDAAGYQRHLVRRLRLPYPLLSDPALRLADLLGLPSFQAAGMTLYKRLTMVVDGAVIRHVFYPIFPPDRHADEVAAWLHRHPSTGA